MVSRTYRYTYDLAGNRTGVWLDDTRVLSSTYDQANQVEGWAYDKAGNLLRTDTLTLTYDPLNRLRTVTSPLSDPTTTTTTTTTYTYNGNGVLVAQETDDETTTYLQDLAAPLAQVVQMQQGITTTTYLHGLDLALSGAQNSESPPVRTL